MGIIEILSAGVSGFLLMASLVVAVGPENAFLLRHGLAGRNIRLVTLFAIAIDAVLIAAGCLGLAAIIRRHECLLVLLSWMGAGLLLYYASECVRRARDPAALLPTDGRVKSIWQSLKVLITVTLLNPNVYLDTVLLVGAASAHVHGAARVTYFLGAVTASALWFSLLGYGSGYLSGLFSSPRTWRVFETLNAIIMVWAATNMVLP